MHHALGDPLAVLVRQLLEQLPVLQDTLQRIPGL